MQQRLTHSSEKRSERGSCHSVYMPVWWRGCFSSADTKKGLKGAAPLGSPPGVCPQVSVTLFRRRLDICSQHPYWINSQFHGRPWGSLLLTTLGDFLAHQCLPLFSRGPLPGCLYRVSHCNEDTLFQHEAFVIKQWTKTLFLYKVTLRDPEEWEYVLADVTCIKQWVSYGTLYTYPVFFNHPSLSASSHWFCCPRVEPSAFLPSLSSWEWLASLSIRISSPSHSDKQYNFIFLYV